MNNGKVTFLITLLAGVLFLTSCEKTDGRLKGETTILCESSLATSTSQKSGATPKPKQTPTLTPTASPTPTPFVLPENVNFAIEPVFDDARPFNAFGYAVVGIETDGLMKYGMINEAGEFVIEPEYEDYCMPDWMKYTNPEIDIGYTWLQKNGLWGFVNEKCEWVVDCKYDNCLHFTKIGFAGVEVDGKWGFISTSGEMVVEPIYDSVEMCFGDDFAKVCINELWGLIDSEGKVILEPSAAPMLTEGDCSDYGYWSAAGHDIVLTDWGSCLLSFDGEILVENAENWIYSISSNGLVFADSLTDGTGYFSTDGDLVIELKENEYGNVFADDGLAIVETYKKDKSRSYRYIDSTGENIFNTEFEEAYNFAPNGIASVKKDGLYGYIDRTGSYVIEPQFDDGRDFDANCVAFVQKEGKWAIIDDTGKLLTDFIFDDWDQPYHDFLPVSVFAVSVDDQYGLINEYGNVILENQFDNIIFSYPESTEGWNIINYSDADLAMTHKDGKYGIISLQGEILLETESEDYFIVSENGYSVIAINGKLGYVDVVR